MSQDALTPPTGWRDLAERTKDGIRAVSRVSVIVPVAATAMLVAIGLSAIATPKADFALAAKADTLTLETAEPVSFESFTVTSADVTGIAGMSATVSDYGTGEASRYRIDASDQPITVDALFVPAGWVLTLEIQQNGSLRVLGDLSPSSPRSQARLTIASPPNVSVRAEDEAGYESALTPAQDGEVMFELSRLDLNFQPREGDLRLVQHADFKALGLQRQERSVTDSRSDLVWSSSLRSGELRVHEHPNGDHALTSLDRLTFKRVDQGAAAVTIEAGLLSIDSRGKAGEIDSLQGDKRVSLKPSILDVLVANGALKACLAIITFVAGLGFTSLVRRP